MDNKKIAKQLLKIAKEISVQSHSFKEIQRTGDLEDVIEESGQKDKDIPVTYFGDKHDFINMIKKVWDGEYDFREENDGTLQVYGWHNDTPEDEEEWMINVSFVS